MSTGICTKKKAGLVHFYVNIKYKILKKRFEGYSVKYIYIYIMSGCVEIRLVQRLLGYYFLKTSSSTKYDWCVHECVRACICMSEKICSDMKCT
jgi:hypothetical protein